LKGTQEMKTLQTELKTMQTNKQERQTQLEPLQEQETQDDCAAGGREDEYGTGTVRGCNINTGGDNNADSRGANRKSCADEGKRKGTSREVPQFGKGCTGSMHHLSGSG
jgi:hypothetical protein